jgi:hypothetical protein
MAIDMDIAERLVRIMEKHVVAKRPITLRLKFNLKKINE